MKAISKLSAIIIVLSFLMLLNHSAYSLEIRSTAFNDNELIPLKYTGLSYNMSPPLIWSDIPPGTKSFVLIADDPDAPIRTWTHWIVYDIPADMNMLKPNMSNRAVLLNGIKQGKNSFNILGYGGPYPPPGPAHRYVFTLYALDIFLNLPSGVEKHVLIQKMKGHVLDECEITGIFGR